MPSLEAVAAATLGLVTLSAVNAAVTTTITSSSLFEPLRQLVARHNERLGELLACDLCTSTWVGGVIAALSVSWLGWTGWDAVLAGTVITFATVTGSAVLKEAANLY